MQGAACRRRAGSVIVSGGQDGSGAMHRARWTGPPARPRLRNMTPEPHVLEQARALLALAEWQAELGADAVMAEAPIDRFATPPPVTRPAAAAASAAVPAGPPPATDPVQLAEAAAAASGDLAALHAAL